MSASRTMTQIREMKFSSLLVNLRKIEIVYTPPKSSSLFSLQKTGQHHFNLYTATKLCNTTAVQYY